VTDGTAELPGSDAKGLLHSGDPEHFRHLVERYGGAVRSVALSFARDGDELDDLCQEIWIRVYERRGSYRGTGPVVAWLIVIARRICVSHARREGSFRRAMALAVSATPPPGGDGTATPESELMADHRRRILLEALSELPDRQREAIMARLWHGYGPDEASTILGCKQASVRSLLREGFAKLRRAINQDDL
jgi:RNA polymerase sigma-70 factor (ECF subfamily)